MSVYSSSPFNPVTMLLSGDVGYSFGSHPNAATTRMAITSLAIASNVVTLGVKIIEGNVPLLGSLASVQGTNSYSPPTSPPMADVTNVALTGVTINAITGIGTVTYAAAGTNQAALPDSGMVLVPSPEVYETVTSGEKGQQFALPLVAPPPNSGDAIAWSYFFLAGAQPGTSSVQLQGALVDIDSAYSVIDSGTSTAGESRMASLSGLKCKFVRLVMATLTSGTSPYKAVGKIGS
jgi:hypothetical protein